MARAESLGMLTSEYVYVYYRNLMATETDVLTPWEASGIHNGRKELFLSTKQVKGRAIIAPYRCKSAKDWHVSLLLWLTVMGR